MRPAIASAPTLSSRWPMATRSRTILSKLLEVSSPLLKDEPESKQAFDR
jgi:hypothetical protein